MKLKGIKPKGKLEVSPKSTPNTSFSKKSASNIGDQAHEPIDEEDDSSSEMS